MPGVEGRDAKKGSDAKQILSRKRLMGSDAKQILSRKRLMGSDATQVDGRSLSAQGAREQRFATHLHLLAEEVMRKAG